MRIRRIAHSFLAQALVLGLIVAAASMFLGTHSALAHGKELRIEVTSSTPDAQEPLTRAYEAFVVYAADLDPVAGAKVEMIVEREGGGPAVDPITMKPTDEEGVYVAQVTYPLFGSWNVTVGVHEFGDGEATFIEEIAPLSPTTDPEVVRQQVLQLFFRFDWRDVAAIIVRFFHTLAGLIWFGLTGLILSSYWFVPLGVRRQVFRKIYPLFLPAVVLSLVLLFASGVYSGIFSAPINPPGVFDLKTMWAIPFGAAYVFTIGFKVVIATLYGITAIRMYKALKTEAYPVPAGGSAMAATAGTVVRAKESSLYRLAVLNAILGLLVAVAIVMAVYLHYISHLAAFIPG